MAKPSYGQADDNNPCSPCTCWRHRHDHVFHGMHSLTMSTAATGSEVVPITSRETSRSKEDAVKSNVTSGIPISASKSVDKPAELDKKHKLLITVIIYFCYFSFVSALPVFMLFVNDFNPQGLGYSLIGATLLDLAENTNSSFESVTNGLVVRSVTYCIGSVVGVFTRALLLHASS